jgi:pyruvoyl-dependent arginine decarboxylase (PvlArgDC)
LGRNGVFDFWIIATVLLETSISFIHGAGTPSQFSHSDLMAVSVFVNSFEMALHDIGICNLSIVVSVLLKRSTKVRRANVT